MNPTPAGSATIDLRTDVTKRRERVAALVKAGKTERQIAGELGVSRSTVWSDKQANAGASAERRGGHHI